MFFILHENLIPRFFCIMSICNDIKPPKPLFLINRESHKLSENNCEISKSAQVRLAILQYFILSSRLITNLQQCYSFSSQHSQMHKHFFMYTGCSWGLAITFFTAKIFLKFTYRKLYFGLQVSSITRCRIFKTDEFPDFSFFRRFLTFHNEVLKSNQTYKNNIIIFASIIYELQSV